MVWGIPAKKFKIVIVIPVPLSPACEPYDEPDNEVSQCCVMPLSGELNGISQALYVVVGIPMYVVIAGAA